MSLLLEIREMTPFVREEVASQVPEKGWLLSKHQKSSCSPDWAHIISGYLDCFWSSGIGVCFGPESALWCFHIFHIHRQCIDFNLWLSTSVSLSVCHAQRKNNPFLWLLWTVRHESSDVNVWEQCLKRTLDSYWRHVGEGVLFYRWWRFFVVVVLFEAGLAGLELIEIVLPAFASHVLEWKVCTTVPVTNIVFNAYKCSFTEIKEFLELRIIALHNNKYNT